MWKTFGGDHNQENLERMGIKSLHVRGHHLRADDGTSIVDVSKFVKVRSRRPTWYQRQLTSLPQIVLTPT